MPLDFCLVRAIAWNSEWLEARNTRLMQPQLSYQQQLPAPSSSARRRVHIQPAVSAAVATDVVSEQHSASAAAHAGRHHRKVIVSICTNKTCKKQGSQQVSSWDPPPPPPALSLLAAHLSARKPFAHLRCSVALVLFWCFGEISLWLLHSSNMTDGWSSLDRVATVSWDPQILKFAEDLHLDDEVEVLAVGCMAGCGNGPNIAMDPPGVVLNHMATPARFQDAMSAVAGVDIRPDVLKATELRLAGNADARQGDLQAAVAKYTQVPAAIHVGQVARPLTVFMSEGSAYAGVDYSAANGMLPSAHSGSASATAAADA